MAAYWDPYGNVDQLPVAVVNSDKGTTYEGKTFISATTLSKN
ncbi:hypothetical protein PO124_22395 [Bacillus licheniformis]|nr:hypothetical protein [Bacillus licheniformis]